MIPAVTRLDVRLEHAPGDDEPVGRLLLHERTIYFEYAPDFIAAGRSISPLKLPLRTGIAPAPALGLHGVFADALPDGWGLLLMDRHFRRAGFDAARLSPLDRLAYLGARTMGALTFHPCIDEPAPVSRTVPLHLLAAAAEQELSGRASELLPELLRAGGSPAGARPKVLVAVRGDDIIHGVDPAPFGWEPWLIKFSGPHDPRDIGPVEYVYSRLARHAGLDVPPTRLFPAATGQRFFGVRRFDRDGNKRVHVHTLAGLLDTDFRVPNLDYDILLRVTARLTRSHAELRRAFRLLVFNVLAHNRDDHGKNFAFIMRRDGDWRLSPAYDLNLVEGPGGEHTMTIDGEARRPTWSHMLALARRHSLDERAAVQIVGEVRDALHRWRDEARAADVAADVIRDVAARLAAAEAAAELPGAAPTRRAPRRAARRPPGS